MDMVHIQGEAADLDGASGDGDDAHDGAQQRGLARSALASNANQLTGLDIVVKAAEERAVAVGEG